jgi:predicted ATP-grasp superfamily ATP-dependent carboligase
MEFGFLTGKVVSVSLLADEENTYTVTVNLPQDLRTSYGRTLEFKGELNGTAKVTTDKRSVTERVFSPLRYLWEYL